MKLSSLAPLFALWLILSLCESHAMDEDEEDDDEEEEEDMGTGDIESVKIKGLMKGTIKLATLKKKIDVTVKFKPSITARKATITMQGCCCDAKCCDCEDCDDCEDGDCCCCTDGECCDCCKCEHPFKFKVTKTKFSSKTFKRGKMVTAKFT